MVEAVVGISTRPLYAIICWVPGLPEPFTVIVSFLNRLGPKFPRDAYIKGHLGQGPPQSTPVSPWFWMPSLQVWQGAQTPPPQSIPASPWFWMPSKQVGQALQGPPQSIIVSPWL